MSSSSSRKLRRQAAKKSGELVDMFQSILGGTNRQALMEEAERMQVLAQGTEASIKEAMRTLEHHGHVAVSPSEDRQILASLQQELRIQREVTLRLVHEVLLPLRGPTLTQLQALESKLRDEATERSLREINQAVLDTSSRDEP